MARFTKQQERASQVYKTDTFYLPDEAVRVVRELSHEKFNAAIDLVIRLNVDAKKSDQMVRGTVVLPHGTGKDTKILVLCTPDRVKEAQEAGADYVGLEDFLKKIEDGWSEVDVIITVPAVMSKLGRLGKILGPKGLMPNPKSGTVTLDLAKAVREVRAGKIEFKMDKYGIVHARIGCVAFSVEQILDNLLEFMTVLKGLRPASVKGGYIKSASLSSTMGRGVPMDVSSILKA